MPSAISVVLRVDIPAHSLIGRGKRHVNDMHTCLPGEPCQWQPVSISWQACMVCSISQCDENNCLERPSKKVKYMQFIVKDIAKSLVRKSFSTSLPSPLHTCVRAEGNSEVNFLWWQVITGRWILKFQVEWLYPFDNIKDQKNDLSLRIQFWHLSMLIHVFPIKRYKDQRCILIVLSWRVIFESIRLTHTSCILS